MKQLKAFLLAILLSLVTIIGLHFYGIRHIASDKKQMGVWTEDAKFLSRSAILENQDENTMLILGSSEFRNATDSPYHIKYMFAGNTFSPILIGRDSYQSLHHAITLASVGNDLKNKKVVFLVSPQWFQRKKVIKESFTLRFSENHYLGMLQNQQLSNDLKKQLVLRTHVLLSDTDNAMLSRIELYEKTCGEEPISLPEQAENLLYQSFLTEKDRLRVIGSFGLHSLLKNVKRNDIIAFSESSEYATDTNTTYDWTKLYADAGNLAASMSGDNPLYEQQSFYDSNKASIHAAKGKNSSEHYLKDAEEYGDMALFLEVCKELDIQPMIIIMPNNGYWMDHTGYPKEERQKTYDAIRQVAELYDVAVTDLTDLEYEKYLFIDNFHFSGKGWVLLNEAIYNYYQQDAAASQN